jgi:MerR family transcriptional regulator, light-induced transcriptional regulator
VRDHLVRLLDAGGATLVAALVDAACAAIETVEDDVAEAGAAEAGPLAAERGLYVQAILAGQRQPALGIALEALRAGHSLTDVYCDLLQPAQHRVGRLWERNEITVAREHMATAVTQYVVAQLYGRLEVPAATRGRAIVTGVEGELHQLGANMVADVLEAAGWSVHFLGTQLPHRDILQAIEEDEPAIVGVSTTMLFNLLRTARLVEDVRRRFGDGVRIVVGGGAFRSAPDVWRELGADGFGRDLRGALALVDELFPAAGR